jgi:hypothetical protein
MAQTKQQKEIIGLAALVIVGALVWFGYFGRGRTNAGQLFSHGPYTPIDAVSYDKVFSGFNETKSAEYKASGRNIFIAGPPPAAPTAAVETKSPEPEHLNSGPMPPPPPPLPVLKMKFFGLGTLPASGPRRAFLLDGEDVRIVSEGDTLPNNIRIIHIGNDRIEYEDTVTGQKNSNNLEMPPPA